METPPKAPELGLERSVEVVFGWVKDTLAGDPRRSAATYALTAAAAAETIAKTNYALEKTTNAPADSLFEPSVEIDLAVYHGALETFREAGKWMAAGIPQGGKFEAALKDMKTLLDSSGTNATMIMQGVNERLEEVKQLPLMFR